MRNIFLFIRRYFNFLFFVVMQIVALYILFHFNEFHEAAFMGVASEVTGKISEKYSNVEYYFHLKKTNEDLVKENESLRNQLRENFYKPDTSNQLIRDSIPFDSLGHHRIYAYRPAKVVSSIESLPNNYFMINRGENQGVHKDMVVISPTGVFGTIIHTSGNFATVMSLLHRQSRFSAKLKKSGETSIVLWDGESTQYLTMSNIPRSVQIARGDSVVTSQFSAYRLPQGILIGTVSEIVESKGSNFYTLRLKPATDFNKVEYATVIEAMQADEQKKLLEETLKKNQ